MTTAAHVYQAITAVTAIMSKEGIAKSRNNSQQGYKFRGIDDVYHALSSHLAANNLCVLPRVISKDYVERTSKNGAELNYALMTVEFDLVSSVDGSKHTICLVGEAMDSADKSSNKAMSAAMKYALLMAFQIPTEGDNDADATTPEPAPRRQAPGPVAVPPVNVDKAVEAHIATVDKAASMPELMKAYTALQADPVIPAEAKNYVAALCTAKRKQLEGKAA